MDDIKTVRRMRSPGAGVKLAGRRAAGIEQRRREGMLARM